MTLKIVESDNVIRARILFEIAEVVDKKMKLYAPVIGLLVGQLIGAELQKTPHVTSILSGKLQADFGLTAAVAHSGVNKIIEEIKNSTIVKLDKNPSGFIYSISVTLLPNGIFPLLNISYDSKGGEIRWVEWLLTKGVTVIIPDYMAIYGKFNSRSGKAIMIPNKRQGISIAGNKASTVTTTIGDGFRVDPEYAGTEDDNFVVNTIKSLYPQIIGIVRKYLE